MKLLSENTQFHVTRAEVRFLIGGGEFNADICFHFSKYKCHWKNSLVYVAFYHIHYIWHSRERSRDSGQPNGSLHKTCKNAVPRTIPVSLARVN
ncbi:uncharacterized protein TNCV_4495831 [Trichonephila clavipes]|nr:uncharacterized protein TNCV_4495831 [Trichonephila clavipes]